MASSSTTESSSSRFAPITFSHPLSSKLTQDNFLVWRKQIYSVIRGHWLQNYLSLTSPPPEQFLSVADAASGVVNPCFLDWEQQDQLILSWIIASALLLAQEARIEKSIKSVDSAMAHLAVSGNQGNSG